MAVAAQQAGSHHPDVGSWPAPQQLEALAPVVRLLSAIGSVPQVTRIGVTMTDPGIDLWVFMEEEDYDAEARVTRAERAYLTVAPHVKFALHVVTGEDIPKDVLPPYTVVFER
jgi:hypothetical protein